MSKTQKLIYFFYQNLKNIISLTVCAITYIFIIIPVGLLMKLVGRDFLNLKLDKNVKSYFIHSKPEEFKHFKRQF